MQLHRIPRERSLSPTAFQRQYEAPQRPVVMSNFMSGWPAQEKWTLDFFRDQYGDLPVPVVTQDFAKAGKNYRSAAFEIPFREYLDKLEAAPTDYRIFLFNLLQKQPELNQDYDYPDLTSGYIKKLPFMFFGGGGSKVDLHFDIDLSNVFLSQFHGRKRILLFAPEQSPYLYRHPFTVASEVNLSEPDYGRFPALAQAEGHEALLHPGETLFIPSGWWHYIEYLEGGFGMALRTRVSYARQAEGLLNIATHFVIDRGFNRLLGERWHHYKQWAAQRRARNLLPKGKPYPVLD